MNQSKLSQFWLTIKKNPVATLALVAIVVFAFLRIWRLNFPFETVFDEVYFPKNAHQYIIGEKFFDIHPPLGKLIIAFGELLVGDKAGTNTVGWRIMPLLAGLATIPVAYWTVKQIFQDKRAGLIAALLVAIDGLFIVYSRTGLMDGFIILFGLASLGFCWQFINRRQNNESAWRSMLLAGTMAGLAVAVKWIGVGFLPLVAVATFVAMYLNKKKSMTFADFSIWVISFIFIPLLLYIVPFGANRWVDPAWQANFWTEFVNWHQQSWNYNVHLDATHPYASKWWSWPFLIRPIWFYYKNDLGKIIGVDGIGNPIVWWGTTLAVVYSVMVLAYTALTWNRKDEETTQVIDRKQVWPVLFVLIGWAAFYLPWTRIGRVLFLYHYMASYLFALLLGSFWLSQAFDQKRSRIVIVSVLAVAVLVGLFFAPIWIAYPIPQWWFDRLMWFRSWI